MPQQDPEDIPPTYSHQTNQPEQEENFTKKNTIDFNDVETDDLLIGQSNHASIELNITTNPYDQKKRTSVNSIVKDTDNKLSNNKKISLPIVQNVKHNRIPTDSPITSIKKYKISPCKIFLKPIQWQSKHQKISRNQKITLEKTFDLINQVN